MLSLPRISVIGRTTPPRCKRTPVKDRGCTCSWKVFFNAKGSGLTCDNSTMIEKGLLELPTVRQIWMNHTQDAINGEPLDYYHSKNPE